MITRSLPSSTLAFAAALTLSLAACKEPPAGGEAGDKSDKSTTAAPAEAAEAGAEAAEAADTAAAPSPSSSTSTDALLDWLAPDPTAVALDRVQERLSAEVLAVVFGVPPKSADLLEERETLDEGLDIVFDGDAEPHEWLSDASLAYTVALSKTPYFVRGLTKPRAEVATILEANGFTKNEVEGIDVYFPGGSFPWRIALPGGEIAAFIPIDVPGAGLEPLTSAQAEDPSEVEAELRKALAAEANLEFVLLSIGPLLHYDVHQALTQANFSLRRVELGPQHGYEGMVRLVPSQSADAAAEELRKRAHPEENKQVQALLAQVAFVVDQGTVVGSLGIQPDQLKHFLAR